MRPAARRKKPPGIRVQRCTSPCCSSSCESSEESCCALLGAIDGAALAVAGSGVDEGSVCASGNESASPVEAWAFWMASPSGAVVSAFRDSVLLPAGAVPNGKLCDMIAKV